MPDTPVIHPLGITVVRSYLLSRTEVTTITDRISTTMLTPFPSLRLGGLVSVEFVPRVWCRLSFQIDCWHTSQPAADRLAEVVRAVMRASANYLTDDAVMGETEDLSVRYNEPDTSVTPHQPRAIVTGHALIRPN